MGETNYPPYNATSGQSCARCRNGYVRYPECVYDYFVVGNWTLNFMPMPNLEGSGSSMTSTSTIPATAGSTVSSTVMTDTNGTTSSLATVSTTVPAPTASTTPVPLTTIPKRSSVMTAFFEQRGADILALDLNMFLLDFIVNGWQSIYDNETAASRGPSPSSTTVPTVTATSTAAPVSVMGSTSASPVTTAAMTTAMPNASTGTTTSSPVSIGTTTSSPKPPNTDPGLDLDQACGSLLMTALPPYLPPTPQSLGNHNAILARGYLYYTLLKKAKFFVIRVRVLSDSWYQSWLTNVTMATTASDGKNPFIGISRLSSTSSTPPSSASSLSSGSSSTPSTISGGTVNGVPIYTNQEGVNFPFNESGVPANMTQTTKVDDTARVLIEMDLEMTDPTKDYVGNVAGCVTKMLLYRTSINLTSLSSSLMSTNRSMATNNKVMGLPLSTLKLRSLLVPNDVRMQRAFEEANASMYQIWSTFWNETTPSYPSAYPTEGPSGAGGGAPVSVAGVVSSATTGVATAVPAPDTTTETSGTWKLSGAVNNFRNGSLPLIPSSLILTPALLKQILHTYDGAGEAGSRWSPLFLLSGSDVTRDVNVTFYRMKAALKNMTSFVTSWVLQTKQWMPSLDWSSYPSGIPNTDLALAAKMMNATFNVVNGSTSGLLIRDMITAFSSNVTWQPGPTDLDVISLGPPLSFGHSLTSPCLGGCSNDAAPVDYLPSPPDVITPAPSMLWLWILIAVLAALLLLAILAYILYKRYYGDGKDKYQFQRKRAIRERDLTQEESLIVDHELSSQGQALMDMAVKPPPGPLVTSKPLTTNGNGNGKGASKKAALERGGDVEDLPLPPGGGKGAGGRAVNIKVNEI